MSPKLRLRRGNSDDRTQSEPASTTDKAASGADRAATAGSSDRDTQDAGLPATGVDIPARPDGVDQTAQGAVSSKPAPGPADRIWHSPAAGLPSTAPNPADEGSERVDAPSSRAEGRAAVFGLRSEGAQRPSDEGENGRPKAPGGERDKQSERGKPSREPKDAPPNNRGATTEGRSDEGRGRVTAPGGERGKHGGTYRDLTEEVAAKSASAVSDAGQPPTGGTAGPSMPPTGDADRTRSEHTAALFRAATGGADRARSEDTAALPRPATGGAHRARSEDTAGLPRPGASAPLVADAAALRDNWQRVQADFVDDPWAAVSDAADLVEHAAQALVGALRQRQTELRGLWDERPAGDARGPRERGRLAGGRREGARERRRTDPGAGRATGWFRARGLPGRQRRDGDGTSNGASAPNSADSPNGGTAPDGMSWPVGARWPVGGNLADSGGAQAGDGRAGAGQEATGDAAVMDATEHLRLVMQRYRTLFNQICRP